ncbi:hypothetical protein F5B22DRAFT_578735 [Xylaria bambusicola]|uniref:uncharacterized protein n=1 Tax=Xylaria bambusicola TaxID=326684 RepID=UPI002008262C|nr:uncharacterized protein F5B22DRAFT_578735 [Xylaria bambusicola]KAI0502967.1 hypothetical protein F5B22DRAFT_578735 [Xylaria bambusicola]
MVGGVVRRDLLRERKLDSRICRQPRRIGWVKAQSASHHNCRRHLSASSFVVSNEFGRGVTVSPRSLVRPSCGLWRSSEVIMGVIALALLRPRCDAYLASLVVQSLGLGVAALLALNVMGFMNLMRRCPQSYYSSSVLMQSTCSGCTKQRIRNGLSFERNTSRCRGMLVWVCTIRRGTKDSSSLVDCLYQPATLRPHMIVE